MRAQWQPTKEQKMLVQVLRGTGWPDQRVANALGVDLKTLKKHCAEELAVGKDKTHGLVISKLMKNINLGCKASIFFYLKTQCGWREKDKLEISDEARRIVWESVRNSVGKEENKTSRKITRK